MMRPSWQPSGVDEGRRRALIGLSGMVAAAMGAERAWAQSPRSCVLTPEAGEGPFYLDPKLIRGDITSAAWCTAAVGDAGGARRRLRDAVERARRCLAR